MKKAIRFIPSTFGYLLLKKLQSERPHSAFFITSYALGDVVYAMAYLSAWRTRNPGRKVILVADPNKKCLIETYSDYDEVIYYARDTQMGSRVLVHLNGSKFYSFLGRKQGIYNTIPDQIYGRRTGQDNLTLMRTYLELPDDAPIVYPHPPKMRVTAIADFEANKGRIAVLNAYSGGKTVCGCEEDLLHSMAEVLKMRGYLVFSNIIGEQRALEGTVPLRCDLLEMYTIADEIPLIVSVRSGIMDWLISTNSKKFVIYSDRYSDNFTRLFALPAWGTRNCKEVHQASMSNEEIVNALEEYIGG